LLTAAPTNLNFEFTRTASIVTTTFTNCFKQESPPVADKPARSVVM